MILARFANLVALLVMPFLLAGVIQRVKSLWSGRKGSPILQLAYDVQRLLRKSVVYSTTTTALFGVAPYVLLLTALASACVVPLLGGSPLVAFPFDFVWLAYVWGLGRIAIRLAALDTGGAFEGMGTAREATFSTLTEPALFLVIGALCVNSDTHTLYQALTPRLDGDAAIVVWVASIVALLIILQVELARMPVDDPSTHLELTMVHEVMVLDHSGPDLAAIHVGSAIKFLVGSSMIATLLNPWAGANSVLAAAVNLALCIAVAGLIGSIESLIARLKLRTVPQYIVVALSSGAIALLATAWRVGAGP
jgi:formate hydrogenlyase subunit 4